MKVAIGLDIGGTDLKSGLVSMQGEVLVARRVASRTQEGVEGLTGSIADSVKELQRVARWKGWNVAAAGLGLPGTVTGRRGTVLAAPPQIPGIGGFQAGTFVRGLTGTRVAVENDATVAALAEARFGAGRGHATVLLATVGTGVGGGLVLGGKLVRGRYGTAGEIGHGVFMPDGIVCRHGGAGCLELYCSATALVRIYGELGGLKLTPREIAGRAREGEANAVEAYYRVGRNLGIGLSTAAQLIAPDLMAIGGGLANAGKLLMDPLRRAFKDQAMPYVTKGCRIVRAKLRNRAGIIGAAVLAIEEGL